MTKMTTVKLETPIKRGETEITEIQLRRPVSGELRGLNLVDIGQLKADTLIVLIPRIAMPTVTEQDVAAMEMSDLMALGIEVGNFLLPKSDRPESRNS